MISDNGPQFSSGEFVRKWEFEHKTSSPYHHEGNGKAESSVKAAKLLMSKCKHDGTDAYLAILELRNTPTQSMSSSPTQLLMNRATRSLLPTKDEHLSMRNTTIEQDREQLRKRQQKQTKHYNKSAKELPKLMKSGIVRIKPIKIGDKKWKQGIVENMIEDDSRSYNVISDGVTYRRNRRDLNQACNTDQTQHNTPIELVPMKAQPQCERRPPAWLKDYEPR